MRSHLAILMTLLLILALAACGDKESTSEIPQTPQSGESAQPDTADNLANQDVRQLADEIWEDMVQRSAYLRLQEGLPVENLGDLTLEEHRAALERTATFRSKLEAIDASALTGDDLITYEILQLTLADNGINDDDYWLSFDITPYVGPYQFQFAQQALAAQPLETEDDARHYLHLANELGDMVDQLRAKVDGQMERGIFLPKPALPSVRATWAGIKAALPDAIRVSPERIQSLSESAQIELSSALEEVLTKRIVGGLEQLLGTLGDDYELQAPALVGLSQYEGGNEVYLRRIRQETTLELTPEQIHQRGLQAVEDIAARMQTIRDQLGFEGTAKEFIDQLKKDPRFIASSPADVEQRFMAYIARIEPKLDDYFRYRPQAPYGVRRLPLASEPGMTYGYYGKPTASEPTGYYNYNASDLPNRSMLWAGSLIYHELLPGHHFHMATQGENESLQALRQNYSVAAYTEGWAEYAASLGIEMDLYQTPEELYGRYIGEMFLATRLVVDTGMNALGWSLEEAREFMGRYVIQSESEIASETLRYSTSIPAQALAYRLGYETMWEQREKAEQALGDKFDIREYHNVVLADGTKPLPVLAAKVDRWIASQQ